MKKIYLVAAASVAVAIISVFLFMGQTSSFQSKIYELSNMYVYNFQGDRIGVMECATPWANYPGLAQADCYDCFATSVQYEVRKVASWSDFKELLIEERDIVSPIFYDQKAQVIWFDSITWSNPYVKGIGTLTTWYIPS